MSLEGSIPTLTTVCGILLDPNSEMEICKHNPEPQCASTKTPTKPLRRDFSQFAAKVRLSVDVPDDRFVYPEENPPLSQISSLSTCSALHAPRLSWPSLKSLFPRSGSTHPPHLLQLHQHLLFLAPFSVFLFPAPVSYSPSFPFVARCGNTHSAVCDIRRTPTSSGDSSQIHPASSPGQRWAMLPPCHGWSSGTERT